MQLEMVGEVEGVAEMVRQLELDTAQQLAMVAELIKTRTLDYLKSLTSEVRPPARKAGGTWTGPRRAHPGHWADVSTQLVQSYGGRVNIVGPGQVTLTLWNSAAYAAYLDAREGYFVLRGVTDPGGPVEEALDAAIRIIAPQWSLFRG